MSQWFYGELNALGFKVLVECCSGEDEVQVTWFTPDNKQRGDQIVVGGDDSYAFQRFMTRVGNASYAVRLRARLYSLLTDEPSKIFSLGEALKTNRAPGGVIRFTSYPEVSRMLIDDMERHGLAVRRRRGNRELGWVRGSERSVVPVHVADVLRAEAKERYREGLEACSRGERNEAVSSVLRGNRLHLESGSTVERVEIALWDTASEWSERSLAGELASQIVWAEGAEESERDLLRAQAETIVLALESP